MICGSSRVHDGSYGSFEFRIERGGLERLDDIEPLWRALRDHHAAIAPAVAPVRSAEASWSQRRGEYFTWLSGAGATLFIADADRALGYLMMRVHDGPPTWEIGERIAEVETLSVLPTARGRESVAR